MAWPPWKQETPATIAVPSGGAARVPGAYEMEPNNLVRSSDGTPVGGGAAVSSPDPCAVSSLAPSGSDDLGASASLGAAVGDPSAPIYSMGECENPIRLRHSKAVSLDRGTGEVTFTDAEYVKPCGNRRAGECAHCSRQHSGDCYSIIQSGLDKKSPFLFVTLTAPGSVTGGTGFWNAGNTPPKTCKSCALPVVGYSPARVREGDPRIGSPYCSDCFDPAKVARWNSSASALWAETILIARRHMRDNCAGDSGDKKTLPKIDYVKIIEPQRRGAIHFHALFRTWKCEAALKYAISKAEIDGHTWGKADFQLISPRDESAAKKCVAYLAKYVTKSTRCDDDLRASHLARVAETARAQAPCACGDLRLRNPGTRIVCRVCRSAHEGLGSRSHVLTKSHTWGRSFSDCRADRRRFHALGVHGPQTALEALLAAASTWKYSGRGYTLNEGWATRRAAEYREMLARPPSETRGAPASISAS